MNDNAKHQTPWQPIAALDSSPCDKKTCVHDATFHNTETGKRYCTVHAYNRRHER